MRDRERLGEADPARPAGAGAGRDERAAEPGPERRPEHVRQLQAAVARALLVSGRASRRTTSDSGE